jgi:TPR repeat protein
MYDKGQGVSQDDTEAAKWYRKAAEQGHAGAQCLLGVAYYTGEGEPKDDVQAHMWLDLAGAQGVTEAEKVRDFLQKDMTAAQLAEAQRLAREWKAKSKD